MIYPTISEYVESILSAEDNFDKLSSLRPVLDGDGRPVMSSGNFAVVFKMKDENTGKLFAVKCFIKDQEGREENYRKITDELANVQSNYLCGIEYLPRELFVDTAGGTETEFPVLKMDWVDGVPLDKYVSANLQNPYELAVLTYQFCRMAAWLITQSFAHGDLKPDNILVRPDGTMTLVDYDGMYVPAMCGEKAHEMGSPDYRHPLRTTDDFNEWIDDFALASVALSLKAICLDPSLFGKFGSADHLLFTTTDYRDLSKSEALQALHPLMTDAELTRLYALFLLANSEKNLSSVSFRLFNLSRPDKSNFEVEELLTKEDSADIVYGIEELSTKVTDEDLKDSVEDEFGVKYSKDGKRLLRGNFSITNYKIKEGTRVICDKAFYSCCSLELVNIPNSVTSIGDYAFEDCLSLQSVVIPNSVTSIGDYAFSGCSSLQSVEIPNSVTSMGTNPFVGCNIKDFKCTSNRFSFDGLALYGSNERVLIALIKTGITHFEIPNSITSIGDCAFEDCASLQSVVIPNTVTSIGDGAFSSCESLKSVAIPNSVTSIGDGAFSSCESLKSVVIPDSVTSIVGNPFSGCKIKDFKCTSNWFLFDGLALYDSKGRVLIALIKTNLTHFDIPNTVTCIGDGAFSWCKYLQSVVIPNSVTSIGEDFFIGCDSLQSVVIPNSVTSIGDKAFWGCSSLQSVEIPNSVTSIGYEAFWGCKSLNSITIPNSVTSIGKSAFYNCKSLQSVVIPNSITSIGDSAFSRCWSLKSVVLPNSVTSIGNDAFCFFRSLQSVIIPKGTKDKFSKLLPDLKDKLVEQ